MYNIKHIFRMNKILYVLLITLFSLLFSFLSIPYYHISNYINSLNESNFISSGYLNGLIPQNTYYVNLSPLYGKYNGNTLFVDFFMTNNMTTYEGNYLTKLDGVDVSDSFLNDLECSISKQAAKKNNLSVGDYIMIRSNFKDYNYKIKYVFDDYYGIGVENLLKGSELIILGYNSNIFNDLYTYNYYHFSKDNIAFSSIGEILIKETKINDLNNKIKLINIFLLVVTIIITTFVEFVFCRSLSKDLIVYKRDGFNIKQLYKYLILDSLSKYLIIGLFFIIISISSMLIFKVFKMSFFIVILFNIIFMNIISIFIQIFKNYKIISSKKR